MKRCMGLQGSVLQLGPALQLADRDSRCRSPDPHNGATPRTNFFVNTGLWRTKANCHWEWLASAGRELRELTGCNVFWKTTTPGVYWQFGTRTAAEQVI